MLNGPRKLKQVVVRVNWECLLEEPVRQDFNHYKAFHASWDTEPERTIFKASVVEAAVNNYGQKVTGA